MKPYIYPYNMKSKSAKALAQALGTKRIKKNGNFKTSVNRCIVNWGSSYVPTHYLWSDCVLLNHPDSVEDACHKIYSLQAMKGSVDIPTFTTNKEVVQEEGGLWIARTLVKASGGKGIIIFDPSEGEVPDAKLYTKYIKKESEYRVHLFQGNIIDVQQKKMKKEAEVVNYQIRNYNTGWVFCREGVTPPNAVLQQAEKAINALGLDFGAVDVIWNEHYQRAVVLEVNTAPGLEGQTLTSYVNAIKEYCNAAD